MPFERSLEIERRLDEVLRLIRTGRFSTRMLSDKIGVSIPTVSRIVAALRLRGHAIRSEKHGDCWRYVIDDHRPARRKLEPRANQTQHAH